MKSCQLQGRCRGMKRVTNILLAAIIMLSLCMPVSAGMEYQEEETLQVNEAEIIEISSYFEQYEQLIEKLGMMPTEPWQFLESNSYEIDQFYLEWDDNLLSMKNEGAPYIKLYGSGIGDSAEQWEKTLLEHEWVNFYNHNNECAYITIINDRNFIVIIYKDENGDIDSWYLNNWPEGDDVADAFSELRENRKDEESGTGNTNQNELDIRFAEQYYEHLVSTVGLADEYIETKSETVEDQGAHTVCLAPSKGNLGIIFKDIADFDENGIGDLIVAILNEYNGKVSLDQVVYFFDSDGNRTVVSSTKDNPIRRTCNYYFYRVGNYMVNIYEEDDSGDWIDGLRYEVIENKVQAHDDEIHIMSYDMDAPDNGESNGEILYIHKDYRYPDSVCYTIDDINAYYAIYNRGFSTSSADDRCFQSESECCDYIYSLLSELLGERVGRIEPTSWDSRWDVSFFPKEFLPESYTILKINATPSYRTGEKTTVSDITIEAEYCS